MTIACKLASCCSTPASDSLFLSFKWPEQRKNDFSESIFGLFHKKEPKLLVVTLAKVSLLKLLWPLGRDVRIKVDFLVYLYRYCLHGRASASVCFENRNLLEPSPINKAQRNTHHYSYHGLVTCGPPPFRTQCGTLSASANKPHMMPCTKPSSTFLIPYNLRDFADNNKEPKSKGGLLSDTTSKQRRRA